MSASRCRGCGDEYDRVDLLPIADAGDLALCVGCRTDWPAPTTSSPGRYADAPVTVTNLAGEVTYTGPLSGMPNADHVVDLFAGPGGWDHGVAAHLRMSDVTGVEVDPYACATRRAAGLRTVAGDVAALDPAVAAGHRQVDGLIASPPCQLYSNAGSKRGRQALALLADAVGPMLAGDDLRAEVIDRVTDLLDDSPPDDGALLFDNVDTAERAAARAEARSAALVLEPARWAAALRPRWIVLEQVPSVLPLWQVYADELRAAGWSAEAAVVNAADYGAPQTRRRAVLVAAIDHPARIPAPTHAEGGRDGLRPWVPMAEALGWAWPDPGVALRPGTYATPKAGETEPRGNRRDHPVDEPAPTIAFGNDAAAWRWVPDGLEVGPGEEVVLNTGRDWKAGGTRDDAQAIPLTEPAPTIGGVGSQFQWRTRRNDQTDAVAAGEVDPDWPLTRPATTIAGRGLVTDPGANANRHNGALKSRNDGVRVEVAEAGILQTFPADYPWTGPLSEQYQQVGNAVPPRLAAHLVAAAAGCWPPTFPDTEETPDHA